MSFLGARSEPRIGEAREHRLLGPVAANASGKPESVGQIIDQAALRQRRDLRSRRAGIGRVAGRSQNVGDQHAPTSALGHRTWRQRWPSCP
jgi:hypothetical protein